MKLSNLKNELIVSTQEDTPICIMQRQSSIGFNRLIRFKHGGISNEY